MDKSNRATARDPPIEPLVDLFLFYGSFRDISQLLVTSQFPAVASNNVFERSAILNLDPVFAKEMTRGRPSGSKGVNGVGLQGPRGSRGRPTGSKGVKERA